MINIRISCISAEVDRAFSSRLCEHLSLRQSVEVWHRYLGEPKHTMNESILREIKETAILVILISVDFFSEFSGPILEAIEQRIQKKDGYVIPIYIRPCQAPPQFASIRSYKLTWLPSRSIAVEDAANDKLWTYVTGGIISVASALSNYEKKNPGSIPTPILSIKQIQSIKQIEPTQPPPKRKKGKRAMTTILFLGANSSEQTRLELAEETRAIDQRLVRIVTQ